MKIFEIVNIKRKMSEPQDWEPGDFNVPDADDVAGYGSFTYAQKSKDDQDIGQVKLKSREDPKVAYDVENDPKYVWYNEVEKLVKSGNPFVPVVYDINVTHYTRFGRDYYKPEYKMKRYHSIDELVNIKNKNVNNSRISTDAILSIADSISSNMYNFLNKKFSGSDAQTVFNAMIAIIERKIIYRTSLTDVNPQFLEVVKLIRNLKKRYPNFILDIKEDNFLIDITSTGLKLVVTDPFSK